MRRSWVIALSLLLAQGVAGQAHAQQLGAGLRTGVSLSDFQNDLVKFGTRVGFAFGGFAELRFAPWFALLPELQFVGKGSDNEIPSQTVFFSGDASQTTRELASADVTINYLELLVPIALTLPLHGPLEPRLYVGPTLALELSCRVTYRSGDLLRQSGCAEESTEIGMGFVETQSFDFGVVLGGGVDIAAGPGAVTADIRYTLGLTNINADAGGELALYNRDLQFLVGYAVRLSE